MGCYCQFCPGQEARPSFTEECLQLGFKKRKLDELRKQYIQEKGYNVIEMYECDWGKCTRLKKLLNSMFAILSPTKRSSEKKGFQNIKCGSLFAGAYCDFEVPDNVRQDFANVPTIFKSIKFGRDAIGPFVKEYA